MTHRRSVEIAPAALIELEEAQRWWLEHRDKAPEALDEELASLVERLETAADLVGQPARNMSGTRRVLLKRIRYYVYFRVVNAEVVQIAALWHASRRGDPGGLTSM